MRPIGIASVLAVLIAAAPAAGAGKPLWTLTQTPEPTDFSQPGENQAKYFSSPDPVEAGKTYTLVVEGDAHSACGQCGTSYSYDGIYQYGQDPGPASPRRCCIDLQIAGHEGHPEQPGTTPPQSVPFDSRTHHYEIKYVPPFSGALEVRDVMRFAEGSTTLTGKIEVQLFGPGSGSTGGPKVSPPSATPKLGVAIDYRAMALGAVRAYKTPRLPPRDVELDGTIELLDNNGRRVGEPSWEALEAQAAKTGELCSIFALPLDTQQLDANVHAWGIAFPDFVTCVHVVSNILARADQIRRQNAGQARAAAALGCQSHVRSTKGAPALRVTCTRTAAGSRIRVRPRAKGKTLAQVLHGHAPMLVAGRSSIADPGGTPARLRVRWTAK